MENVVGLPRSRRLGKGDQSLGNQTMVMSRNPTVDSLHMSEDHPDRVTFTDQCNSMAPVNPGESGCQQWRERCRGEKVKPHPDECSQPSKLEKCPCPLHTP